LPYDPGPDFVQAAAQDRLGPWLDSLPPPYTGYQTLRKGLATYRDIAAARRLEVHRGGRAAEAGRDRRSAHRRLLEARLAVEDTTVAVDKAPVFDEALQQALMRAQKRFGLNPDGGLGPATLAALNVPVERRIDQILANMERWRWLPQQLPADRIQVNIAAAVMSVFHDDAPNLTMRAVTGRPGDETPMLQSTIHSIVLNPPWNVPSSIATKELWPKERANPGYLAQRLHRHLDGRGDLAAAAEGRAQGRPGPGEVRLRQSLRRLSARHAQPLEVRQLQPPGQPRLRASGKADPAGQATAGLQPRLAAGRGRRHPGGGQDRARPAGPAHRRISALLDGLYDPRRADELPRRPVWLGQGAGAAYRRRTPGSA
jgi:hypothetical protein